MSFLKTSSAAAVGMAGILIFICWVVAAKDNLNKRPGGCIEAFHKSDKLTNDLKKHFKANKDAYPVLISFGAICGVFWLLTFALSFVKAAYYLISGIFTTIMFICAFTPLVELVRFDRQCKDLIEFSTGQTITDATMWTSLFPDGVGWAIKHKNQSYEIFWGSSIACFLLAAYQIGCAIAMVCDSSDAAKEGTRLDTERALKELPQNFNHPEPPYGDGSKQEVQVGEESKTVNPTPEKNKNPVTEEPVEKPETFLSRAVEQQPQSVYVKKGEVELPKESPLPEISNADFTLNDF